MNYHWGYGGIIANILVAGYFQDYPSNRGIFANLFNDGYNPHIAYGSPSYYI